MALPVGLIAPLVFVLTVGLAASVTFGAHSLYRVRGDSFAAGLRTALIGFGGLYLAGTVAVWWIAGGLGLWEIAATLVLAGIAALLAGAIVPLLIGQRIVQRVRGVDAETALRFATYGWPVAMLVAFGVFVVPGGFARGHLLSLGGERICLVGFCGISRALVAGVVIEAVVALLGPGLAGLLLLGRGPVNGHP